ncbi:MAG: hypothetical protein VKS61_17425 [Candidatus Sericytochromatia bacterium]|jgi:hypothetical protein|nr:hypothetical protein [Candidatus Sericytochromatia bacterium]
MSKAKFNRMSLLGGIALAVLLAGCGNRMPANVPDPEEPPAPAPSAPAPSTAPVEPVAPPPAPPVAPGNPNYQGPTVGSLVVSGVEKTKSGLIFKKLTVKGTVVNMSSSPLSGTLKIDFKDRKGLFTKTFVTEETKTQVIASLAPGQSLPFEITATKNNMDEAEVTVETIPAAPAAGAFSSGSPYGAPAGYPMGAMGVPSYPVPGRY